MVKKTEESWEEQAEGFLKKLFLPRTGSQPFLTEQFRRAVKKAGIQTPENLQLWGGFMLKAKSEGVIRKAGYGLDSHGSPKTLWRSM